jgi:hypothetical protein
VVRRLFLLHAADVAGLGLRVGQGAVVGVGVDWSWSRVVAGNGVSGARGLVLVVRLLALLILAVVVVGAVVVVVGVVRVRLEFHLVFVFDDGYDDGLLFEGDVVVGCACGWRGGLGLAGGLRKTGSLRVLDCCCCWIGRVLNNGRLSVLSHGVRPFGGSCCMWVLSCMRVLGRRGNDGRSSSRRSSVRVLDGLVNNRMNLACCR